MRKDPNFEEIPMIRSTVFWNPPQWALLERLLITMNRAKIYPFGWHTDLVKGMAWNGWF